MSEKAKDIKVTDKRIFTADGDIREEFRGEIKPGDPLAARTAPAEAPPQPPPPPPASKPEERRQDQHGERPASGDSRNRSMADKALNPGTAFADFAEGLIAQGYMLLGMLRDPYGQKPKVDVGAARQMIEILTVLKEKTAGNLTPDEDDFLSTHLGELKLAFVQRTKTLS